jgi:hypothetical protein
MKIMYSQYFLSFVFDKYSIFYHSKSLNIKLSTKIKKPYIIFEIKGIHYIFCMNGVRTIPSIIIIFTNIKYYILYYC